MENSTNEQENKYFTKKEAKEEERWGLYSKRAAKKFIKWIVAVLALGLAAWLIYKTSSSPNIPEVRGEYFKAQTREHIAVGVSHPAYNSNPPTGGWHYDSPAQSGIYDKELSDEQLIHNLEHGHVWISYRPDLDKTTIDKLAEIAKSYGSKIIMAPRAKNDSFIALSAWEYLLKLDNFDENQINGFIKAHRGKGPENIPVMSEPAFKDFRTKK